MIGQTILNYRIIGLIGHGGMGSVYLAEHMLIREEKVAIKVINADMANDYTRQLLHEEAKRLATLNHPNIVGFKNFHIDQAGNIYLIMEYAKGKSLEDYIATVSGLIVESRVCPLFEPILDAVGYAHSKGILHCDIKPANVVITEEGIPKVLDFGIARIMNEQGTSVKSNTIMGTPSYMSPEQAMGESLDSRSDIYSLGVLLHQMLTGNAPYDTTTLTEQQITDKVIHEPLPRIRTYYKYVSEKVQKVVDKATAKNPSERYQSCAEFKRELHRAIYPWRPTLWMKVAAAVVVLLIAGIGLYVWDYNRIKVTYYKDYVERWGVPEGVGKLSSKEHSHINRSYKFVSQKRRILRVSHVNSLDAMIDDGESERNERPVDQSISYDAHGQVSKITVRDRSGKVLYVKSFNEKLNTMTYQWDDEHNTERVRSNKTVGHGRLLEQNDDDNGRISRNWIEYDEHGFVTKIRYADMTNTPAGDENGIFGQQFVRDDKGRAIEIHYIGIDGEPQPTKWGLGVKKFEYDDADNLVRAIYLTTDGKSALDDEYGTSIYELNYDKWGNVITEYYRDGNGNPMYPKISNVAGVRHTYDEQGFETEETYIDENGEPMFRKWVGYAIGKYEYDERGYVSKETYCDTEGNPIYCVDGNAWRTRVNDEHGDPVEEWYYGTDGSLCQIDGGIAGYKAEYDSIGNVTLFVSYGTDKKPCPDNIGSYGHRRTYNDRNQLTQITFLGADLEPAPNYNKVTLVKYDYDKRGNNTKIAYFQADGTTLTPRADGYALFIDTYDDQGNHTGRQFFGADNKPVVNTSKGYASVAYTYDENNNQNSTRYYDASGRLTLVDGVAGYDYVNDKSGNTLEDTPLGTDGKQAVGKLKSRYKYDQYGNMLEQALYDKSGHPATNYAGIHRYTYSYNTRNQRVEENYFGRDGKPVASTETKFATERDEYDDNGNRVRCSYFGTDGKPCVSDKGWSSSTYEYDRFGNIVKQSYFTIDGTPTDPKVKVPVDVGEYDRLGNLIYSASQDSNGNLINDPKTGYAVLRAEYNIRGNMLWVAFYDKDGKPANSDGYHKAQCKYDEQGRMTEKAYFGCDLKPTTVNGCHRETYRYQGSTSNYAEVAFFGIDGKPVNCSGGWHNFVVDFGEDGVTPNTRKFYRVNGSLLAIERWDGTSWQVVKRRPYDWQVDARQLIAALPIDFGEEYGHIRITKLRITGTNSCEVTFTIPYNTSILTAERANAYKEAVNDFTKALEEGFRHKAYVTGNLYDASGSLMYSIRY